MNATYRATLRFCFHKHLDCYTQKYMHPDLNPSRTKKDKACVLKILETISTTFIGPLSPQPRLSISNGVLATDKVSSDMLSAKAFGKAAMDEFIRDRLSAKISLVAQIRSLNMRVVFEFPLGPLPWSLAEPLGSLKKTSKASLLHQPEGKVKSLESLNVQHALIVNGMAYVQQSKVISQTFGDFANDLLQRIPVVGARSSRIDVVFDDDRELSIKNVEGSRRAIFCLNRSSLHLR